LGIFETRFSDLIGKEIVEIEADNYEVDIEVYGVDFELYGSRLVEVRGDLYNLRGAIVTDCFCDDYVQEDARTGYFSHIESHVHIVTNYGEVVLVFQGQNSVKLRRDYF
jgi:hypothetical protein